MHQRAKPNEDADCEFVTLFHFFCIYCFNTLQQRQRGNDNNKGKMRCCIGLENYPGCIRNMKSFAIFTIQFTHFFRSITLNRLLANDIWWNVVWMAVPISAFWLYWMWLHHICRAAMPAVMAIQLTASVNQRKVISWNGQLELLQLHHVNFYSYSLHARIRPNLCFHSNERTNVNGYMLISWIVLCRNSSKRTHGIHACHYMRCYADYGRRSNRKKTTPNKTEDEQETIETMSKSFVLLLHAFRY